MNHHFVVALCEEHSTHSLTLLPVRWCVRSHIAQSSISAPLRSTPWLPDGYSQIFRSYVFGPSGFWTMGQNATVLRVIREKMPSECLQNCPRNVERSSSSEDSFGGTRTSIFSWITRRTWHFNIITRFWKFCSFFIDFECFFDYCIP